MLSSRHCRRLRTTGYEEVTVRVTSTGGFVLRKVFYTLPSLLIGHRLQVRLYDDRLDLFLGASFLLTLPRGRPDANGRHGKVVNYHHVVHALRRKPMALLNLVYRAQLFPPIAYRRSFEMLLEQATDKEACMELVGFQPVLRESAQSWHELLCDLKHRGLSVPPALAIGDGALGFWNALDKAFSQTRHQRCWVHKTANIVNKFPKSMAACVKADLNDIHHAPTREEAVAAMNRFKEKYSAKYMKAVDCLFKGSDELLVFFDFPAEHWVHLRTTNPIESVFATGRHRTVRTKGALSQKTAKLMVFTLIKAASRNWRMLKEKNQLPKIINGVKSQNGLEITSLRENSAA